MDGSRQIADPNEREKHQARLVRFERELAELHAQKRMIDRVAPGIAVAGLLGFGVHWAIPLGCATFAGILWAVTRYIRYTHVLETEERILDTKRLLAGNAAGR